MCEAALRDQESFLVKDSKVKDLSFVDATLSLPNGPQSFSNRGSHTREKFGDQGKIIMTDDGLGDEPAALLLSLAVRTEFLTLRV